MQGIATFKGVVYPAQCDAMGHMNIQHYTAAFDSAFWHLIAECGYSTRWISERREGWADVRHELDFLHELSAGELFVVGSEVVKIGSSSLTTRHTLYNLPDQTVCAQILIVSVYFDLAQRKKKELPETIRASAARFL